MWSNHMELEIESTEVVSTNNLQVEIPNAVEVAEGKKDYEVSVVKKEYTIIGDSIFIPSMYEDAPPWLKEFIDTTINVAVTNRDQSLIDRMHSILTAMDYVPKNQYTEQINQIVSEDGIINSRIATLNSNLTDAISSTNATIAEINLTYASKDEAAAIATNVITASLSGSGEIGSVLIQLQEAYANLESTTAQSISMLESVMEGEINGNATAMETIRTYVGIDEAGASTGTGLSAYLEASDGTIGGADSQLANTIRVTAEGVESKWAYNSIVNINGTSYSSGFGIATSLTSGSGLSTGQSEFWIKADKFKLMSANGSKKSSYSPFTVDSVTGDINFNGKVTFNNVTNVPQLGSTPQEVVDAVNSGQTTTINGGKITTGSITANQIATESISADRLSSTNDAGTVWSGGGLVSTDFNGNVNGDIGTPTQGFRLSSNAAGTMTDPNIFGGVIRGGLLYSSFFGTDSLKCITPFGTSCPFIVSSLVSVSRGPSGTSYTDEITLVAPSYLTGYRNNRLASTTTAREILCTKNLQYHVSSVRVERSIDSGSWSTIISGSAGEGGDTLSVLDSASFTEFVKYRCALWVDGGNSHTVRASLSIKAYNFD